MDIKDIQTGDTLLISGTGFVSRTIEKVMKRYGKKYGLDTSLLFSHAGRFVWIAGELYVFGSIDSGYKPWLFRLHYNWNKSKFAVMRRKRPLTVKEQRETTHYCLHLTTISLMYQYWNFIQWLLLTYTGINLFRDDSNDFTYCYEAEALARKQLSPFSTRETARTSIFDLLYDPAYEIIYKSKVVE